ncbi:MAG: DUF3347 domain-containing protein [Terrimonas sp.]|nr:DUF3347 domain-containing protein [Terrimonas sp.]
MKKILLALLILVVAVLIAWKYFFSGRSNTADSGNKLTAMAVSKHSPAFNASMQKVMDDYYRMTEGFVNWDTNSIRQSANALKASLDSLKIGEMAKDSAIYPTALGQWEAVKSEAEGLMNDEGIAEKRASLNMLSQQLFDLLRIIRYDLAKVYFQECPMALNNYEMAANWLSPVDSIRNPYLGTRDPKYGDKMLTCGSSKVTLDYRVTDTTKN